MGSKKSVEVCRLEFEFDFIAVIKVDDAHRDVGDKLSDLRHQGDQ